MTDHQKETKKRERGLYCYTGLDASQTQQSCANSLGDDDVELPAATTDPESMGGPSLSLQSTACLKPAKTPATSSTTSKEKGENYEIKGGNEARNNTNGKVHNSEQLATDVEPAPKTTANPRIPNEPDSASETETETEITNSQPSACATTSSSTAPTTASEHHIPPITGSRSLPSPVLMKVSAFKGMASSFPTSLSNFPGERTENVVQPKRAEKTKMLHEGPADLLPAHSSGMIHAVVHTDKSANENKMVDTQETEEFKVDEVVGSAAHADHIQPPNSAFVHELEPAPQNISLVVFLKQFRGQVAIEEQQLVRDAAALDLRRQRVMQLHHLLDQMENSAAS